MENRQKAAIEALLFTMGSSVKLKALAETLELDEQETLEIIKALQKDYEDEGRGLRIIELDNAFQMCSKPEYYDLIVQLTKKKRNFQLTDTMVEVLAIIAYKQPVTRAMVEAVRGVNSDHSINRLIEYGLVQEAGRLDAPGRPVLFGTTEEFLRTFGVKNKDDLPVIDAVMVEEFKEEAEREADSEIKVGV